MTILTNAERDAPTIAKLAAARAMLAALQRIVNQGYGLHAEAQALAAITQAKIAGIKVQP